MSDERLPEVAPHAAEATLRLATLRRLDVHVFRAPIDTPVRTSFGLMRDRPAVLVRAEDEDGAAGWGEVWCNFPACGAEHRGRLAASVLAPRLLGRGFASPAHAHAALTRETRILRLQTGEHGPLAQAISGVDLALWDLVARRAGQPLHRLLGGAQSANTVPAYASGINPETAVEVIARAREAGFSAFKVKIGFDDARDRAVVRSVADSLAPGESFMVDANQGWTLEQARRNVPALVEAGAGWLEEPLAVDSPATDWAALADECRVPLAGGENLTSVEAFMAAADAGHLQVLQPDVCKWGGISLCVPVARYALRAGRRYCPHYLGGGVGLLASAHALGAVGGDGLLEVDINPNPLRVELMGSPDTVQSGRLRLPQGPGIGVDPPLETLRAWQTLKLSETG
ncbi:mandelate racemase/muconate lactonizing enzyme family protein [Ectothiorhodospiraceae bacterium WFHF3C12]|nr:mandelate racemase/muconate lactonizing enzyme family protein [Ectothiorhodospiraceae bacterium WFHF3C12]